MIKKIFIYTFFIGICFFSLQSTSAANITVNPGQSIQSAVNHASSGDTIIVNDNHNQSYTYNESVIINKKLNIIANGKVSIDAKNSNSAALTVYSGGSGTSIENFKVAKTNYAIVICDAQNCLIEHNSISGVSLVGIQFYGDITNSRVYYNNITGLNAKQGNGISFEDGTVSDNTIYGNTIRNFLNGILFNDKSVNNIIEKNRDYSTDYTGAGIYTTDNSNNMQILSNEVIGARDGIAVQKMGSGMACNYLISGNVVKNNVNGFWIQLTGSKILKNTATSNKVSGLDITGSYNTIEYNTATGNDNCGISLGRYSSADHNLVSHNVLSYNIAGINSASRGSTISYNTVTFNKNNGIISVANNVTIVGNIINNTARRIIAEGTDVTCQS